MTDIIVFILSSIILYFILCKKQNIKSLYLLVLLGIREFLFYNSINKHESTYWNRNLDTFFYFILILYIGYSAYTLDKTMPKKIKYSRTITFLLLMCMFYYICIDKFNKIFTPLRFVVIPILFFICIKVVFTI